MSIYTFNQDDELVVSLREHIQNNPLIESEYPEERIRAWNTGIAHTKETKKRISEARIGVSTNKGSKRPWAKENLKCIKHRAFGHYRITNCNGEEFIIINLKIFCIDNQLNYTSMSSLANGKWPCKDYRGYTCEKLGYIKIHQ